MDNKEQITTRAYKIKAIVIGILAVMVYIASQYVMFCNLPILEPTGECVETDFLKWAINRNIGCIVLGIILMLIPYEWLADKFIKSHEKKLKNSALYRICTIIGAGILLPIVAILLAIAIPTGHPDTAIICCAGSVIVLGVFVFPLFENKINYQGYLALVGFISMVLIYVLTLYQKTEYTNDFYRFQMPEDRLQYLFILFIFLSIIIAAFVQCITKKEGSLKYNILVFIWIAIIAIFCWAIVFNLLGMAGEDGFTLKLHSLYMQYMDSGMSAFHSSSFIILLGMLAVNIVFSAIAVKCTSKYSASRADILRWVTIMFVMLTVWQIGVGCTKPYDRCDFLVADHTYETSKTYWDIKKVMIDDGKCSNEFISAITKNTFFNDSDSFELSLRKLLFVDCLTYHGDYLSPNTWINIADFARRRGNVNLGIYYYKKSHNHYSSLVSINANIDMKQYWKCTYFYGYMLSYTKSGYVEAEILLKKSLEIAEHIIQEKGDTDDNILILATSLDHLGYILSNSLNNDIIRITLADFRH